MVIDKKGRSTMVDKDAWIDFFVTPFCPRCGWNHTDDEPCEDGQQEKEEKI